MATAPLPTEDLEVCLAPFGRSRMLPRSAYVDAAVHAWEVKHFFRGGWICAGRTEQLLPATTSQAGINSGGRGILLTRDASGTIRAFENICRHRGHELLACGGTSAKGVVVCPYHAWSYGLDGMLRSARGADKSDSACAADLGLIPMAAAEWGGWIFINASGERRDLDAVLGDLPQLAADWECERLVPVTTHNYRLAANWKVVIENYLECYHCPSIHPALCRVSDARSGGEFRSKRGLFTGGWMELEDAAETMSFDGRSGGLAFRCLSAEQRRQIHYFALFPGMLIALHPDYVMTHRLHPCSTGETEVECQWLFSPETVAEPGFDPGYAVEFWDRTNREDWQAVESVQRGLASERFVPGILATEEYSVYNFVHLVASAYLGRPRMPHSEAA